MKTKRLIGAVALVVFGIVFGAVLVSGFGWVRPGIADIRLGAEAPPVTVDARANSFSEAFIQVAEKVTPSIVQISVVSKATQSDESQDFFFPFKDFHPQLPERQEGSGSGIIINADGYVLTNNHVVENAEKVTVSLIDKRQFDAQVIGTDPLTDLAVLKINATGLVPAYLGNSDSIKVGQWVMAIGNPLALSSTVTAGIISALNRGSLRLIRDSYGVENFIQTDAAINPGNSGGALVDLSGAVIGVNTAIATRTGSYIGYGFAIPINLARSVAQDLIAHGKINRGYIGVQIREVDSDLAKALGLDKPKGVIIQGIVPDGAASKEDIKEGDVILKIDGIEVSQPNELQSYVAAKLAGAKVILELFRDGKTIERTVTLIPRKDDETTVTAKKDEEKNEKKKEEVTSHKFESIGLTVRSMNTQEKEQYKTDTGVMIASVDEYSKAFKQGLGRGLVITRADRQTIEEVSDLKSIIESKKGKAVLLQVLDGRGTTSFIGIEIPN